MKENNNNSHLTRQQSNAKQEKGNLNEMLNRVHYAPEQRRHVLQNTSIHYQDTHSLTHKLPNCMEMQTELSLWLCTRYNKETNNFFIFSSPSLVQIALQNLLQYVTRT